MKYLIETLSNQNKTIATMESCTGGGISNAITNVEGASDVFSFGAVTYSNDFKIKMGVDSKVIDKYTVYSIEVANEMSKAISNFANSNYGIGITGKLNKHNEDNIVYISIYDKDNDKFYNETIQVSKNTREDNKKEIIDIVINKMLDIL